MPISSTTRKTSPFTGNGVIVSLPFTFKVFATSDVEVIRTTISTGAKTTLVLSTDYTVTLNANQDTAPGGTVTLNSALASGYTAIVVSNIPQTQPTSLTNAGGFFPSVISAAFDRATALVQQLQERLSRTPALPKNDTSSWPEIPGAASRADTVLGFNESGVPALIPKADFIGPAGPAGADGAQGPQGLPGSGGVDGDGLPLTGGTMTGDITMKADADGGVIFARASDDVVQGRVGRNNDALALTAVGATIPLQLGANGIVRFTVLPGGAVRFEPLASAPSSPAEGWVYSDSTNKRLRWHNGTEWRDVITEASPTSNGPLTLSLNAATDITQTTAKVSVTIAGDIPSGALMQLQITSDISAGPWVASSTPSAARGVFEYEYTGLTSGVTYTYRAFVYPSTGPVYAVSSLGTFTTALEVGDAPSMAAVIADIDEPQDARTMHWIGFINDPANVAFVGGNLSLDPPATNLMGAIGRGTTMPAWAQADGSISASYKDSDIWPFFTPWSIVAEASTLADKTVRAHSESNAAIHSIKQGAWIYRISLSAWQRVRFRSDLQGWFNADEATEVYDSDIPFDETRSPVAEEGTDGVVIKWTAAEGFSKHGFFVNGLEPGFVLNSEGISINLSLIASDIGAVAIAHKLAVVPWNRVGSFTEANAKLVARIGADWRAVDNHGGGTLPGVVISRSVLLTRSPKWIGLITLRDTIRQDRADAASNPEAGLLLTEFEDRPIPDWLD
ncbi:MAG: hypothetical protein KA200_00080 [Burkholderiales bacterium]|nr:hypothetical protein [Burkholderiales bacterium]